MYNWNMTTKIKFIIIAAAAIFAIAIAAFVFLIPPAVAPGPDGNIGAENQPAATGTPPAAQPTSTVTAPTTQPAAPSGITMVEVAKHSSNGDCWTAIRGSVYNLTAWISKHPGGEQAILKLCGKDGTAAFVGKHGGSSKQENTLVTFKIGVIAP
jgi:hypothetical protein